MSMLGKPDCNGARSAARPWGCLLCCALARVTRGPKRELISRSYNALLRNTLRAGFSDAQCGFKAIRREAADALLPLVADNQWFFDTELLVVAERAGLRIHEVPVDWVDDPDSRVDILRTAYDDLRGIARLGRGLLRGSLPLADVGARLGRTSTAAGEGRVALQVVMFAAVGVVSTVAFALLFLALRQPLGPGWANALALALTAVGNTAANRRFTFGLRGPAGVVHHHLRGLLLFGAALAATTGALALTHALGGRSHGIEVAVLTVANLAVTVARFLAMRLWVFARR